MTLNDLEHENRGFYGFYICSQWAFIHALLSRVPFALAGLFLFSLAMYDVADGIFAALCACTGSVQSLVGRR